MSETIPSSEGFYLRLVPPTYVGPPPLPHPACTAPTPDEQVRLANEEHQQELARRQLEHDVKQKSIPKNTYKENISAKDQIIKGAGGVFSKVKSVVTQAALQIEKGAADATVATKTHVRQLKLQTANERFRQHFPELALKGEVLLADYECSTIHSGMTVNGHLQITRSHLCFCSQASMLVQAGAFFEMMKSAIEDGEVQHSQKCIGVKEAIPLTQIASIQRSVALETLKANAPCVIRLPDSSVILNALQVFTIPNKNLYQFVGFDSIIDKASNALSTANTSTAIERAYNYMDHAWREAVKVPIKDVEYI
ncbi:unnamed protein product [Phytomonas sp. Hart1]|nr:unnamed protein product [Phytomonas sp. Hart1]|eukprot:CCW66633.1 unnamed protein product [Phytomonas sp. isolate Hart1]